MARAKPCDNCKRRKTRCLQTPSGQCQYCVKSESECTFDGKTQFQEPPAKLSLHPLGSEGPLPFNELGQSTVPEPFDSAVFFGPSADQDPFLLQHYPRDKDNVHHSVGQAIRILDSACNTPVCFSCIKKPENLGTAALDKLIDSHRARVFAVVEPYKERLLALYFRFIDWNFPALDRLGFYNLYYNYPDKLHTGLLAAMLAISCIYWKYDTQLCIKPIPPNLAQDLWSLCQLCIDRESSYPTLQVLQCQLLYLQKRLPRDDTCEHFGLATQLAKVVSVVYSLGIHVDCTTWNISNHEKKVRKRLWWCAYVVDKWTAAALGRPSLFHEHSSNLPPMQSEYAPEQLFVQICGVTYILNSVLTDIYPTELRFNPAFNIADPTYLSKVQFYLNELDLFENALSPELSDMSAVSVDDDFCRNGILRLKILCVRSLLLRVYLNPQLMTQPNFLVSRQLARDHISAIIKFTCEITHSHLHAFWLASCPLNFSLLAHFVFYYYVQSSEQEKLEVIDSMRKWLWALRVLANTWQEGTGLATLRMDAVFYMGKTNVEIPIPLNLKQQQQEYEFEPFADDLLNPEFIPHEHQSRYFEQREYIDDQQNISNTVKIEDLVNDDLRDLLMETQYWDQPPYPWTN